MSDVDGGRNAEWPPDSVPLAMWESVIASGITLSGPDVGRLRVALDTLADADLLAAMVRAGELSPAESVQALREIRQARATASAVVATLTGSAAPSGASGGSGWGGRREGAGAKGKSPQARHGNASQRGDAQ